MERVAVAGGVSLHVERREGDGADFLLVHGLASNLRLWDGVAERLAGRGHHVVSVDLRGHGRSDKPDEGYDLTTVTDDVARLVKELGLARPVLVGQSWGGNVVLEAAWRMPGLTRGVACVDGGWIELRRRFADWPSCRRAMTPPATTGRRLSEIEGWLRQGHLDWSDLAIAGALACFEHRPDGTVAPWLSLEHHLAVLAGMWEHAPSSRYAEIQIPVLLVPAGSPSTAGDGRRGQEVAEAAATLPRCQLEWIEGDHDLHAHHPEALATLLHQATIDGFFG